MDFTELDALLSALPNASKLTAELKEAAAKLALVPDEEGRLPADPGYLDTYDWAFAAYNLSMIAEGWPVTTNAGSENTTVTVTPPNWRAIRAFYASLSPILQQQTGDHLTQVTIDMPPHYRRHYMGGRHGIDTDMG